MCFSLFVNSCHYYLGHVVVLFYVIFVLMSCGSAHVNFHAIIVNVISFICIVIVLSLFVYTNDNVHVTFVNIMFVIFI